MTSSAARTQKCETRAECFRFVVTAVVLVGVFVVLGFALVTVNTPPFLDPSGSIVDPFDRAGTIVAAVLPFVTLTLGYWFGTKGTETANAHAAIAQENADRAARDAATAQARATMFALALDQDKVDELTSAFNKSHPEQPTNPPN